ncbi:unnamed protein product [Polarella glacialis]|uniref:Major facilitator superfamily (MFS) profile domain-containing protein n=1 Tax=Polarella glacialis TaxID=89957 RepID=A0A813DCZ9_POLGL|nr:unnamed protein product [Polarella glacialis]
MTVEIPLPISPAATSHLQGFGAQLETPPGSPTSPTSPTRLLQGFGAQLETPPISPDATSHLQGFGAQLETPPGSPTSPTSPTRLLQGFGAQLETPPISPDATSHLQGFGAQLETPPGSPTSPTRLLQGFGAQLETPPISPDATPHLQGFGAQLETPPGSPTSPTRLFGAQLETPPISPDATPHLQGFGAQLETPPLSPTSPTRLLKGFPAQLETPTSPTRLLQGSRAQLRTPERPSLQEATEDSSSGALALARQQRRALVLICAGTFSALSIWFSASAVLAPLSKSWSVSEAEGSFLTSIVNIGFCAGCLLLAVSGLTDVSSPSRLICVGSLGAAAGNLCLLLAGDFSSALLARLCTGLFLSMVYPPGVKLLSTWFSPQQRGSAIGVMFAAFCLGSAFPQLLRGIVASHSWQPVVIITSTASAVSGLLVFACVGPGPFPFPASTGGLEFAKCAAVFQNPHLALTILAYCGHMWELFCVWAWVATFLESSWLLSPATAPLVAFAVIAMGAPGSWVGGRLGDRLGRARVAAASLAVSGSCIAVLGLLDKEGPMAIRICVFLIWGLTALSDSPQFSVLVTIHADPKSVGTAITVQMMCGYLVTVLALWLVPHLSTTISWRWSFFSLAAGPMVSLAALWYMGRRAPEETWAPGGRSRSTSGANANEPPWDINFGFAGSQSEAFALEFGQLPCEGSVSVSLSAMLEAAAATLPDTGAAADDQNGGPVRGELVRSSSKGSSKATATAFGRQSFQL